jgi:hypothetical protein
MTELPRHPDAGDATGSPGDRRVSTRAWWIYALAVGVVLLLVLMVVLHLSGVIGPGSH